MTKKDLIEIIKQNMPQGLTQLEKARYIYIELGKQRRFDTRYYYGNSRTRRKIYRLAEEAERNPEKFHNRRTLICVSLSYLYQSILKEFGIESRVVNDDLLGDGHVMPALTINDEKRGKIKIRADLQRDLECIQTGMQTRQFGTPDEEEIGYDIIDEQELREIDKKIGYIKDEYRDIDVDQMAEEVEGMNAIDGLKHILQDARIYKGVNFQGQVERRKYYRYLLETLLKLYINKKIFMFSCYRENISPSGEKERNYTLCAYAYEGKEFTPYLYSNREEKFLPVSFDKLAELEKDGLVLGTSPHTKGLKLLRKTIARHVQNKNKSVQNTNDNER